MRKNFIRAVSFIMVILTVALTACSQKTSDSGNNSPDLSTAESQTASAETSGGGAETGQSIAEERADYKDSLPDNLDFGGKEYRILTQHTDLSSFSELKNEMIVEELTGEVINDTIYNRAQSVSERLNVDMSVTVVDKVAYTLTNAIAAGDNICDISAAYAYYITKLALDGSFINWLNVPHIDLEKPWWPESLSTDLVMNDRLYFISGDISMKLLQYTYCIFYNKTIAEEWNLPDLYEIVLDGKWTIDKYIELASSVSKDLDGNGKFDRNDLFGALNTDYSDTRFASYEIPISTKNEFGELELCLMSEKFVDMYNKLYGFYSSSDSVIRFTSDELYEEKGITDKIFISDHLLFYPYFIFGSESFRDMESDYGIVPYPKYDEKQEEYHAIAHDNYSLMCIPSYITEGEYEMIGAVTEAMAAESYRKLTPAYLEVAMKDKFLRDANSAEMLDIIMSSLTFDPAAVYSDSLNDILHIGRQIYSQEDNITSFYKKNERPYKKAFDRFNQRFARLP